MELIFATSNADKAREVANLLPNWKILTLKDIGFTEDIEETADTLEGNALIKAKTIFDLYGKPTFADDTGLSVEALNGAPGVYSARYAGATATYKDNCDLLLKNMQGIVNRNAVFRTVFSLVGHSEKPLYFRGEIRGTILEQPRGEGGFGYDPVFKPLDSDLSFAEMSLEEKNKNSHRSRALKALAEYMASQTT